MLLEKLTLNWFQSLLILMFLNSSLPERERDHDLICSRPKWHRLLCSHLSTKFKSKTHDGAEKGHILAKLQADLIRTKCLCNLSSQAKALASVFPPLSVRCEASWGWSCCLCQFYKQPRSLPTNWFPGGWQQCQLSSKCVMSHGPLPLETPVQVQPEQGLSILCLYRFTDILLLSIRQPRSLAH